MQEDLGLPGDGERSAPAEPTGRSLGGPPANKAPRPRGPPLLLPAGPALPPELGLSTKKYVF